MGTGGAGRTRTRAIAAWAAAGVGLLGLAVCCAVGVAIAGGRSRDDGLIRREGEYPLAGTGAVLRVSVTGGSVSYRVVEGGRDLLEAPAVRPSASQRWFLEWDEGRRRLWVYSSDLGTTVCERGEDGRFRESPVVPSDAVAREMPRAFREGMPETVRRRFAAGEEGR